MACDPFLENVPIIPESKKRRQPTTHINGSTRKEAYLRFGPLVRDHLACNGSRRSRWNRSQPNGNISEAALGLRSPCSSTSCIAWERE
jgi:hypothetical protein